LVQEYSDLDSTLFRLDECPSNFATGKGVDRYQNLSFGSLEFSNDMVGTFSLGAETGLNNDSGPTTGGGKGKMKNEKYKEE